MQIIGDMTVFRNEHDGKDGTWYTYATTVAKKREDGSYARVYLDVRFRKGITVENKSRLNVKDGFLTVREYKQNGETKTRLELMVLDFDYGEPVGYSAISDSDLPF